MNIYKQQNWTGTTRSKPLKSPEDWKNIKAAKQVAKTPQSFLKSFPNAITIQNWLMFSLGEFT